ncbi:type IX secretion/gliding motility protein PorT/SprT [Pedobacter nutrimenti]|uniref:Outer membrane protein beta-barrel domain-containing protein n=1 Tax=Pedobacter nutrimenti TaxID=1241337 RepID=A0A318UBC7_9SPHI|nr:outer membrane beta-barrel protein [Pedobacter nutrimenti]PYF72532.1 putative protein-translocating porin PorT [Pedobacter nutrimenti]
MKKHLGLFFFFLLSLCTAKAQNWGGGVDDSNIHFGFTFQYLSSDFKVFKKPDWQAPFYETDKTDPNHITTTQITSGLKSIMAKSSPGFGIGFVVNSRISDHVDVRLTPSLVFNDRLLQYTYQTPVPQFAYEFKEQKVQATMVDIPLGIKLKSDRRNNFRAYLIGNIKYSMDISSAKKTNDEANAAIEKLLKNQKSFWSYETGIGFDLYFEYFKMSPEIKYSSSFNSILKQDHNAYSSPLDKLMLRHVTFSLYFE